MSDAAIVADGLVKSFGRTRALDGFDMRVETGRVTGFLGPNGAGKSTAIRVFLGLLRADAGTVQVLGHDAWRDAVSIHRRVAYVPGDASLWPNLTGGEAIDLLLRLRGSRPDRRRDELLDRFDLDPTKKARTYSRGNRQKVVLIAALAANADLFVFDEPTSGLDPLMEAVFTDEVRALRNRGSTVLLSSHILAEVEKVCDAVTIIRAGKAVESGTLSELRHLTRSTVTATIDRSAAPDMSLPGVHNKALDDQRVRFDVDHADLPAVLRALADAGVENLTVAPPSLEELFLRHYADDVAAGDSS